MTVRGTAARYASQPTASPRGATRSLGPDLIDPERTRCGPAAMGGVCDRSLHIRSFRRLRWCADPLSPRPYMRRARRRAMCRVFRLNAVSGIIVSRSWSRMRSETLPWEPAKLVRITRPERRLWSRRLWCPRRARVTRTRVRRPWRRLSGQEPKLSATALATIDSKPLAKQAKSVSAVTEAAKLPPAGLAVVPVRNAHAL